MSLHAQLSPEAQERLHAQQRNSTITSMIISILVVLLIGIVLLWILLPPIDNFTPEIVSYQAGKDENDKPKKREMTRAVERKPSAPSSSMAKVIAANTRSNTAIPVPEIDVPDPSTDFGDGDDFGDGWGNGDGDGGGGGFGGIPQTMRDRCTKSDRLNRLAKNGGNPQCEDAVVKSLRWLKKTQNADGSWTNDKKVAMTGFAVLAFLGHCETPNSEEFGDAVTRGIIYLVNVSMKNGGKLAEDTKDKHWPYEHAIATYALGEASTFCTKLNINLPKLNDATKLSGDWILEHQHSSGSWDYSYDMSGKRGGDNSIGLWHIQALKACKHTGLWPKSAFNGAMKSALDYIRESQNGDGGIGYSGKRYMGIGYSTLTGGGMLAMQMWGKGSDKVVRQGSKYVKKNAKLDYNTEDADLYAHYYYAQAMINRGGADWSFYNKMFRDQILNNQNADGSWKNVGGGDKVPAAMAYQGNSAQAVHYRTCLATFMLEVYYRFLPATGSKR